MQGRQTPSPRFFVNAASKGFRYPASALESTYTGSCASVDSKAVETSLWRSSRTVKDGGLGRQWQLISTIYINTQLYHKSVLILICLKSRT